LSYSSVAGRCADAAPLSASRPRASASSGGSGKWRRPTSVVTITHSVRPTMRASYASEACRTYTTSSASLTGSSRAAYAASGSGPTSAISPRSTFQSWGSSSTFTARSHAPNGNTRGSRAPVMRLESERRRRCIVRSLNMMNGRRSRPTRSARYRTGPADDRRMPTAARATSGAATTAASAASTTSTRRLATAQRATHGHEHLGGLQTLLVTPRPGTVAQRLERAGVRIRPQLALVARHRGQLLLECRRDVHPGVGHEATGKPPFGAAGGVVGVHRLDRRLGSPGGDEHGLEQDLVIAVDVAPVLAVDDLWLHFPDDALERRDDLGEGESVEPQVRKAERAEIGDAEDVSSAAHVLGLADPGGSVAEGFSLADDHRRYGIARFHMQRDRTPAPQELVIGMGGDHQHPLRHARAAPALGDGVPRSPRTARRGSVPSPARRPTERGVERDGTRGRARGRCAVAAGRAAPAPHAAGRRRWGSGSEPRDPARSSRRRARAAMRHSRRPSRGTTYRPARRTGRTRSACGRRTHRAGRPPFRRSVGRSGGCRRRARPRAPSPTSG